MSLPPPDPIYILRGLGASVTALEFFKPGTNCQQKLLSGDYTGVVNIWNLLTKRTETTLKGHNAKSILHVQQMKDNHILSHGRDGYVQIWTLHEGRNEIKQRIEVSDLGFCKCEILNDKNEEKPIIAVLNRDQSQIDIVDLKSTRVVKRLKPEGTKSFGMCMCLKKVRMHDGVELLLAGYESGDMILWDTQSAKAISELNVHKEPVMCIDFDSKSRRGISGSAENSLVVFKLTTQEEIKVERMVEVKNAGISAVKIRADGKILATGGWDCKLRIFSWKSLKPLAVLNYHSQSVDALTFSECDKQTLAAGSKDGRISLWSLYNDTCK